MADYVRVNCAGCRAALKLPADRAGKPFKCGRCGVVTTTEPIPVARRAKPVIPPAHTDAPPVFVPPPAEAPSGLDDTWFPEPEFVAVNRYRQRGRGAGAFVWLAFALLLTAGLVAGAITLRGHFGGTGNPSPVTEATTKAAPEPGKTAAPFPRRMLVLSTTKYLFCNGLTAGEPSLKSNGDHVTEVARRLAFEWRIPTGPDDNQLIIVSDTSPREPRPMLRPVIREAYERFFQTSRAEDRIVVYFGGHALTFDDKAYLVPADGDPADPDTLIALADFYGSLAECPAHQKAVIFDVCRMNESDDRVRPGGEPMSEELERSLLAAPSGVQVVLTCSAGERAWEFRSPPAEAPEVAGSLFLSALKWVAAKGKVKGGLGQTPADPIPVSAWADAAAERAAEVARLAGKPTPTVKREGGEPAAQEVAANLPPPGRFAMPTAPAGRHPQEVRRLFAPAELPPLRPSAAAAEEPIENVIPFAAEALAPYMADPVSAADVRGDPRKYPFRSAALTALDFIRKEWSVAAGDEASGSKLMDRFDAETDDQVKQLIRSRQEAPARIILELDELTRTLDALLPQAETETSRYWRVMFEFARAELKTRLAFMHEYNNALAAIVTDSLPDRDPQRHSGLQLVSTERMRSKRDIKELADEGKELFGQIAAEHPGTPWAVQARRAKVVALGLAWQPLPKPGMTLDE